MCRVAAPGHSWASKRFEASALALADFAASKGAHRALLAGIGPCASSRAGISVRVESSSSDADVKARLRRDSATWQMRTWRLTSRCIGNADTQHIACLLSDARAGLAQAAGGCYTLAGCLGSAGVDPRGLTFLALARALCGLSRIQAFCIAKPDSLSGRARGPEKARRRRFNPVSGPP